MSRKSLEYWAAPASTESDTELDRIYSLGEIHARAGRKPNLKGIPQHQRCYYMAAYNKFKNTK
ncbi:MAG: hypothetical protein KME13_23900 [Myxacorys californica WJT36-NPBG1]|nr:hypothetical protein [Myxacorys californica WJT36-NPBG1]